MNHSALRQADIDRDTFPTLNASMKFLTLPPGC